MPFVDFVSRDDRVSLWYTTNTPYYTVGSFDPEKPTIIMLPPLFLDSSWLGSHIEDPRLSGKYNIVAFDMRVCGKSDSRPSGAHDSWVDAADLAFAHQVCHIISSQCEQFLTEIPCRRWAYLHRTFSLSRTSRSTPLLGLLHCACLRSRKGLYLSFF